VDLRTTVQTRTRSGARLHGCLDDVTTIHHQLLINAPASRVYKAIATADGISTWWDKQTSRQTERGLVLEHNPGPEHGIVQLRVVELIPNKRIEWECISTHAASSPASAWTGTHFIFELADRGDHSTAVDFRQTNYDERSTFVEANRNAWRQVLQNLKQVVEAGRTSAD
jgi:uncharacterized protein YndB with AHSA1/START domain